MTDRIAKLALQLAQERYKTNPVPYYTTPESSDYLCVVCGEPIADGVQVAALHNTAGRPVGVVASADPSPFTPGNFVHRCGTGQTRLPPQFLPHDASTPEAERARAEQSGAPQ